MSASTTPNFSSIPGALQVYNAWVLWRREVRADGKGGSYATKVPYSPLTRTRASTTDPKSWGSFTQVRDLYLSNASVYQGIGYVLHADDPFFGLDLDGYRNPETGEIAPEAREILDWFDTYAEITPSGCGLHVIGIGKLPGSGAHPAPAAPGAAHMELYDQGRYLTMTGFQQDGTPVEPHAVGDCLFDLYRILKPEREWAAPPIPAAHEATGAPWSDEEIIKHAMHAANGANFSALWSGDLSAHKNDHSAADMALCCTLVFWCGRDPVRIDRIFRLSGLYRQKWDSRRGSGTYGQMTIDGAITRTTTIYKQPKPVKIEWDDPEETSTPDGESEAYTASDTEYTAPDTEYTAPDTKSHTATKNNTPARPKQRMHGSAGGGGKGTGTDGPAPAEEPDPEPIPDGPFIHLIGHEHTDLGNATRFAQHYGEEYCYSVHGKKSGTWMHWDGSRWAEQNEVRVYEDAGHLTRRMAAAAKEIPNDKASNALLQWAYKSQASPRIEAMTKGARGKLDVDIERFDQHPLLLNCANGMLDLETGKLYPHDRGKYLTRITNVNYNPDATCPLWDKFLEDIQPDSVTREFLQRAAGYSLTGLNTEQVFFILYGTGFNGKSTFLNMLRDMVGMYGYHAAIDTFMRRPTGGATNDIAALAHTRLVTSIEVQEGRGLAEQIVKAATGGDPVRARFLYQEYFDFVPEFKLWLAVNSKPVIREQTHAMWRRVRLIPFAIQIPVEKQNKYLPEHLRTREREGVLAWMVRGGLRWHKEDGLEEPDTVKAATSEYRNEMDNVLTFVQERCVRGPEYFAERGALFGAYNDWCNQFHEHAVPQRGFAARIIDANCTLETHSDSKHYYHGIGLSVGNI